MYLGLDGDGEHNRVWSHQQPSSLLLMRASWTIRRWPKCISMRWASLIRTGRIPTMSILFLPALFNALPLPLTLHHIIGSSFFGYVFPFLSDCTWALPISGRSFWWVTIPTFCGPNRSTMLPTMAIFILLLLYWITSSDPPRGSYPLSWVWLTRSLVPFSLIHFFDQFHLLSSVWFWKVDF